MVISQASVVVMENHLTESRLCKHNCFLAACIIFHISYVCLRDLSIPLILSGFMESSSELKLIDKCPFSMEIGPCIYCLT